MPGRRAAPAFYGKLPAHKRPVTPTLLHEWLAARGTSRNKFARQIGVNHKTVDYWCDGRVMPELVPALRIEAITEGGVPVESWVGTPLGRMMWKELEDRADG